MKIFVLIGETDEYDSHTEHIVKAYRDLKSAENRMSELYSVMAEVGVAPMLSWAKRNKVTDAMRNHPKGDPDFYLDYSGASYSIEEAELE